MLPCSVAQRGSDGPPSAGGPWSALAAPCQLRGAHARGMWPAPRVAVSSIDLVRTRSDDEQSRIVFANRLTARDAHRQRANGARPVRPRCHCEVELS
eukprot:4998634-Prymnesium_polylepis.1